MTGDIYFGTVDLAGEIVKGIQSGVIQWGIDQHLRPSTRSREVPSWIIPHGRLPRPTSASKASRACARR